MDSWSFHRVDSSARLTKVRIDYLTTTRLKLLKHLSFSLDLVSSDLALFFYVKVKMKGSRFVSDEDPSWTITRYKCVINPIMVVGI